LQNDNIFNCVIAAGGKGTRLESITNGKPKALAEVGGKAIIFDQIDKFIDYGCTRFDILLGYKSEQIQDALDQRYINCKIQINYHVEPYALGSGGALLYHLPKLPEKFIFTYCDIFFDFNISNFINFHLQKKSDFSLICHPNDHPQDSDLVVLDENDYVIKIKSHPHSNKDFTGNLVNAAFYVLTKSKLLGFEYRRFQDFAQSLVPCLIGDGRFSGYITHETLKDMGTPERIAKVQRLVEAQHGRKKNRKVIFLDRDGTLNQIKEGQYITNKNELTLIPGVAKALSELRHLGYMLVLITNQPVLARGDIDHKGLTDIHARLDWLLIKGGAYLDYKFICPHHPDTGFDGEVASLKINCNCRKPEIGLFHKSTAIIDVDLQSSWMVGDSWRDIQAGHNFGIRTCLLSNLPRSSANLTVKTLNDFVQNLSKIK
jgi:histidinol-phosphate phosphatase family protein